jgi:hypothetical protein
MPLKCDVSHLRRYPGGPSLGRAVRGTRDGSVAVTWPGGDLAVTLDVDYAAAPPPPASGGDGDRCLEGPGPLPTRLLALYRNGGIAASWESAAGGFVQYPSGALCLQHNTATGQGDVTWCKGWRRLCWAGGGVLSIYAKLCRVLGLQAA